MIVTYGIMFVCDLIIPMRVTEEEEHMGLDISMHNESVAENTMKVCSAMNELSPLIPRPSPNFFPKDCCFVYTFSCMFPPFRIFPLIPFHAQVYIKNNELLKSARVQAVSKAVHRGDQPLIGGQRGQDL